MSNKPNLIIGLYGVSGSGKSHSLATIKQLRPEWRCLEGSQVLLDVLNKDDDDDGQLTLEAFKRMDDKTQTKYRVKAAEYIRHSSTGCVTVVAGHCSFPVVMKSSTTKPNKTNRIQMYKDIFTENEDIGSGDAQTYHVIIYLDKSPSTILRQREHDTNSQKRVRDTRLDLDDIHNWIEHEKEYLTNVCNKHGIKLILVKDDDHSGIVDDDNNHLVDLISKQLVAPLVNKVEAFSRNAILSAVRNDIPSADIYLMIDGDRTLTAADTGELFFQKDFPHLHDESISSRSSKDGGTTTLVKSIFQRYSGYSFQPFWEISMLYGAIMPNDESYIERSKEIGGSTQVEFYDKWVTFLSNLAFSANHPKNKCKVHPILISCSNREVWLAALEKYRHLSENMTVIAGNHCSLHDYVVDGTAKRLVVNELRKLYPGCHVIAFGDSELDVPMMKVSDRSYVVVDHPRHNRSMSNFIDGERLVGGTSSTSSSRQLFQLIDLDERSSKEDMPSFFWHDGIRIGSLSGLEKEVLVDGGSAFHCVKEYESSNLTAKILASQTRRADLQGPTLQVIHEQVGMFLVHRIVEDVYSTLPDIFVNQNSIFPHVQGGEYMSPSLKEHTIVILPLMRAGDPMARGIYNHRLSKSHYVHYNGDDTPLDFLTKDNTDDDDPMLVIVVDSVINRGTTIRAVLDRLYYCAETKNSKNTKRNRSLFVYVLSGVMQKEASLLLPKEYPRTRFYTLRVSNNQYTGKGGTDTGNRLFSTTSFK